MASNPCVPSPCGPNSQCRVVDSHAACSCLPNFIGRAPQCRPECTINAECSAHLACQCDKCVDPCPGSCGALATCRVVNHQPVCTCPPGYTGDPFSGCSPTPSKIRAHFSTPLFSHFLLRPHYVIICREQSLYLCQCTFSVVSPVEAPRDPCNPSPCGANAICKERNGAGACMCMREFFGDPYTGCRPECVLNTDCSRDKACVNNKCKNPCIGTCGINAECRVINHAPSCSCYPGYIGDPLNACHQRQGNCKFCIPKRGAHFAS